MIRFQYPSDEVRDAVRSLKVLGLCKDWPDADKREGFIPKPVEIALLEQSRERVLENGTSSAPLDALQERIDVILDGVKPEKKARVAELLFFALGTDLAEIEKMRQSFWRPAHQIWVNKVCQEIPSGAQPRCMHPERRHTIFA
ncbi:MAG: hypothetical protein WC641_06015 [Patescibacteria group bacterium]